MALWQEQWKAMKVFAFLAKSRQQREEELMLLQQTIAFETAKNRAKSECIFDVLLDDYLGESGEGELRLVSRANLPSSTRC